MKQVTLPLSWLTPEKSQITTANQIETQRTESARNQSNHVISMVAAAAAAAAEPINRPENAWSQQANRHIKMEIE